jgi:hypothetical protein
MASESVKLVCKGSNVPISQLKKGFELKDGKLLVDGEVVAENCKLSK